MNAIAVLTRRNLLQATTSQSIKGASAVYCGFDPTADSLHAGNLLSIIALLHFRNNGIQPIALIGGATGSIGDPSGRSTERVALHPETIAHNVQCIQSQLTTIFKNANSYFERRGNNSSLQIKTINNLDWYKGMSMLDFMQDIGRFSRISAMLSRDSVKSRLDNTNGLSFTEFTYQLLQAYDFYHLFTKHQCSIQLGGSDQWGNIISGIDLIKRKLNIRALKTTNATTSAEPYLCEDGTDTPVYGVTIPLMTTSTGEKFGKSAGNAIWLDPNKLSPFDFYQYFRRINDDQVRRYLHAFTFLEINEIEKILNNHAMQSPQKVLAMEVTELVHGLDAAQSAHIKSQVLYEADISQITTSNIQQAFLNDLRLTHLSRLEVINCSVIALAIRSKVVSSKNQAKKMIASGGLYLNNVKVSSVDYVIKETDLLDSNVLLMRCGKSNYGIIVCN